MDLTFLSGQLFTGLSVASILLLAALGLALSFGLMRVINMAHGEFLMAGGYLTYLAAQWAGPNFLWLAFPLAFVGAGLLGAVMEFTVIRRLYGRPLDTLLATFGISLILQQAARQLFGSTGVPVTAPAWLSGALNVGDVTLPYVRLFVIALALIVLGAMWWLLNRSRFGMHVRAVNQNREMAAALGVNTRALDLLVFALGAGIAGVAGVGLALIAPVNPTVGAAYIVNAFLVVVVGGVGSVLGGAVAAVLLGFITALAEGLTSVSLAQAILLVVVVAFLQWKPRGLFPTQSRALEDA
ncbi:urea transport system permease protein [Deinococcus metalli]|uniref:Branched-chain amino acid ABC transporter permease n=1 Tax=Deinococcus metalli TaxID=1141878 RepID=A0A7W8KCR9_9DEIO|nr:urea ABC transporter permease subunit UrtB [Deinococcus metalli]MBB5375716.1 urea transport system permease protein [Deinococcus metalli]GHF37578.1 branched-chain amino acid ABC transporter permease [Deinococcus metalli]